MRVWISFYLGVPGKLSGAYKCTKSVPGKLSGTVYKKCSCTNKNIWYSGSMVPRFHGFHKNATVGIDGSERCMIKTQPSRVTLTDLIVAISSFGSVVPWFQCGSTVPENYLAHTSVQKVLQEKYLAQCTKCSCTQRNIRYSGSMVPWFHGSVVHWSRTSHHTSHRKIKP